RGGGARGRHPGEARRPRLHARVGARSRGGRTVQRAGRPGDDPRAGGRRLAAPRSPDVVADRAHGGVSRAGTVGGDARLRLFRRLSLPAPAVDSVAAWQHACLSAGRIVAAENLHVTLAFLGSRPAGDVEEVAGALRDAAAGVPRPVLRVRGYRETRSVGMLV